MGAANSFHILSASRMGHLTSRMWQGRCCEYSSNPVPSATLVSDCRAIGVLWAPHFCYSLAVPQDLVAAPGELEILVLTGSRMPTPDNATQKPATIRDITTLLPSCSSRLLLVSNDAATKPIGANIGPISLVFDGGADPSLP